MGCLSSKSKDDTGGPSSKSSKGKADPNGSLLFADPKSLSKGRVEDHYEIGRELGRGTFSIVKEGTNRRTGEKVALKFIDKKYVDKEDLALLTREIDIMKKVNHENVLSLKEIYETESQLSLVMELVTGGELFFKIVEKGMYSEKDASNIVRQIVQGVKYLHSLGIAHRDLKPENLLCSGEENMTIKIAVSFSPLTLSLHEYSGTPDYAAPEVLTGESSYEKSVDLWSVGVVTYVLLCGFPPFYAKTQPSLFEKIIRAEYSFPDPEWTFISETAKDFIRRLLVLDPKKRLTAEEALEHPFLSGGDGLGTQTLQIENSINTYMSKRKKEKEQNNPNVDIEDNNIM